MAIGDKWFVEVVDYDAEENAPPVKRLGPMDERKADKTEMGLNRQLNHDQYFTRMVIAHNLKLRGK